jgi:hypothetical protein
LSARGFQKLCSDAFLAASAHSDKIAMKVASSGAGAFGVGVAEQTADNTGGAAGAINARYRSFVTARFRNSTAGDLRGI